MKLKIILIALLAIFLGGCVAHGHGTHRIVTGPPVTIIATPPSRIFYGGRWLHHRNNAYHYRHNGAWVVARSVPTHVAQHHRTDRPTQRSDHSDRSSQSSAHQPRSLSNQRQNHSNRGSHNRRQH